MKLKNKYNKIAILIWIGLSFLSKPIHAQIDTSLLLNQKMGTYQSVNFRERLFIHTDKSFYVAGEAIWMKFYLTDALLHKPSAISKIVYVELIDKNNNSVLRNKFQLDSGLGDGQLILAKQFLSGNYTLRGYTQWMRNEGHDAFFEQNITIVNTLNDAAKSPNVILKPSFDFQFFPEGGNLVQGVECKIAFKVVNELGQGVDCQGILLNDRNDTLVKFSSFKLGMGHFLFKPMYGEAYRAIVKVGDSILKPIFPIIHKNGYSLRLENNNTDSIELFIYSNGSSREKLYLLHHGVQFSRKSQVKITNGGQVYFKIAKQELNAGINRFTIFNAALKPVCERTFFNFPKQRLVVTINTNQDEFGKRSKIQIALNTNLELNKQVISNLSMSVYLTDSIQASSTLQDIESYLLLSKNLNGVVQSPSYYLDSTKITNLEKYEAIDNLMLTQGWSSYKWENVIGEPQPILYLPELEGPLVHANINYKKNNLPAQKVLAYFTVPGNPFYFASSKSNDKGELLFNLKSDLGANEAILQAQLNSDSAYRISIIDPYESRLLQGIKKPFLNFKNVKLELLNRSIASQSENVYSNPLKDDLYKLELFDTIPFYGKPTNTYHLDAYTRFTSMEELTKEYVQEVKIKKKGIDYSIVVWNNKFNMYNEKPPFMMMDGVPIFNANKLFAFDPLKIKKIDIVAQSNLTGSKFSDGIINFITYNGDLANFPIDENALVMEYRGAQATKLFYSPKYPTSESKNSSLPDLRNVLHWEPYIRINNLEQQSINFYSGDLPGRYAIVVQGLSDNGLIGSSIKFITVK
jgi:hypothetical protein